MSGLGIRRMLLSSDPYQQPFDRVQNEYSFSVPNNQKSSV